MEDLLPALLFLLLLPAVLLVILFLPVLFQQFLPAYFQNPIAESFSFLLTGVFVILLFFLFFNKVPSVISHAFRQYPVLSYYLVSFGWVPYFMIAGIVFLPPAATVYEWSDETVNKVADMFNMFCNWGIPCSLLIAWGRKRLTGNSPQ